MSTAMSTAMSISISTNPELYDSVSYEPLTEPVTAPCGHSYNLDTYRSLISANPLCPICRAPLPRTAPAVNIVLREMVARALTSGPTSSNSAGSSSAPSAPPALPTIHPRKEPAPISLRATKSGGRVHLSFSTAEDPASTMPTVYYDILDTSGSMGAASANEATTQGSDASRISRSALVRHSVSTQIESARPDDMVAVCVFDTSAKIILRPTRMDAAGKALAKLKVPEIRPGGGTNLWNALYTVLEDIKRNPPPIGYNVCILFQTDGESDPQYKPPRGIDGALRGWLDANPTIAASLTIHTIGYGFGTALDMPLLKEIAEIGKGSVNYVPDGSMLGTVFIHLMANLMNCHYRGLFASLRPTGPTDISTGYLPIGFLQGGQSRDFLLTATSPFQVTVSSAQGSLATFQVDPATLAEEDDGFYQARNILIHMINIALTSSPAAVNLDTLVDAIADLVSPTDGRVISLLTDIRDDSPAKGQIGKALESANFSRWGRHYLSGYVCGLQNQWGINFRDEASKLFGCSTIRRAIDRGDELFLTLTPPVADVAPPSSYYGYGNIPSPPSSAPINMRTVSSVAGPCFTDGLVLMADGTEQDVSTLQPGDRVAGGHQIRCVIKTLIDGIPIVRLGRGRGAGFTLYHPILLEDNTWGHPCTVGHSEKSDAKALYNFILWTGHILILNGVRTCTMAHEFTGDPIIEHAYFGLRVPGRRNIMDDLSVSPGFETGYVVWSNVQVENDPETGHIHRMTSSPISA